MRYFLKALSLTAALTLGVFVGSAAWELADIGPHNRFVKAFNDYTESMNRGVLDLKKVHKMRQAWRDLERAERWPIERKR